MRVVSLDTASHYRWGEGCDGWHLVQAEGLSVIRERMPPGTSEVSHFHRASRQLFFVLRGVLVLSVPEGRLLLRAEEGLEVPPGTPHQVLNEGPEPAEFLVISQPPSHGDRHPV
jgi:mannose-6-phosphate isomerase-like protein (cupin superfamily)